MKHPVDIFEIQLDTLEKGVKKLGIKSTEEIIYSFGIYINLLLSFNRKFALISKTDEELISAKHILPSIGLIKTINENIDIFKNTEQINWLDIGTGAGLPAIPMKIFLPNCNLTMIESIRKKVLFLKKTVADLKLVNTNIIWTRIENFNPKNKFDLITIKAIEKPFEIVPYIKNFLADNGIFIWIRGRRWSDEVETMDDYFGSINLKLINRVKLPSFYPSPRLYALFFANTISLI